MAKGVIWFFGILLLFLSAGCQGPQKGTLPSGPPEPLVWPKPPERPRIKFLASIAGPQDLGIKKSFLARLVEVLTGRAEEWLIRPSGVAEREGLLAVADPGAQALYLFDRREGRLTKVTKAGAETLISPVAVAISQKGLVYLSDSYLRRVFVYSRGGTFLALIGGDELQRPTGLAYDDQGGRLYVADTTGHRIAIYQADGTFLGSFGRRGLGEGEFNFPTSLFLDRAGLLYVTDSLNYRIQIFDGMGRFLSGFGRQGDGSGDFASPKGVGVDSQGHIYVVDALFDAVQIFDRQGRLLLAFGGRGIQPGQFWLPSGLYLDEQDRIYVADSYNQRIQIFQFLAACRSDWLMKQLGCQI